MEKKFFKNDQILTLFLIAAFSFLLGMIVQSKTKFLVEVESGSQKQLVPEEVSPAVSPRTDSENESEKKILNREKNMILPPMPLPNIASKSLSPEAEKQNKTNQQSASPNQKKTKDSEESNGFIDLIPENLHKIEGQDESKNESVKKHNHIIVDIDPSSKFVFITDPETRLPVKYHVGDKLKTGEKIEKIDGKSGLVEIDGAKHTIE